MELLSIQVAPKRTTLTFDAFTTDPGHNAIFAILTRMAELLLGEP